ncbi:GAF domain-containing protein [Nocardia sp. alder85J]|uniref:GAF domain-containing protein n=1 Tax=Nocardia sp. alder85J TaxID=2862949 RepID=UPI001CD66224|nr:GAF domain-containing protein [Nocardia sp. alder85J]MCX4096248.1 DUF5593 domain-containing protein [Nocardia sp. alder85J]
MKLEQWTLIETLGAPQTWSVVATGTAVRHWTSLPRAVPPPLLPMVTAAHATGKTVERRLPQSRSAWSGQRACAIPTVGPDGDVHAVQFRVGPDDPPEPLLTAGFILNCHTRQHRRGPGMGGAFGDGDYGWEGGDIFQYIQRFDRAVEMMATLNASEPDSRFQGEFSISSYTGLHTVMMATRNSDADPKIWPGVFLDITDSVPPQEESLEAAAVDMLCDSESGQHLALVDTDQGRVSRWLGAAPPNLRWDAGMDVRTIPHPDDRPLILAARRALLDGAATHTVTGLRLAAVDGGWLTADVEARPAPTTADFGPPQFALVRMRMR